ncbi:MAG: LacI family transcriptional regulator [Spirochaetaceae bacterium]|nr:MAG: LacI family transcriptional regulator [Spirochaetaceae bacterium]
MGSMKDVAKLAGVSVSTVSRVITGNIPVEQQTRVRVEDAIRVVNYRPNLIARGLRSKNSHLIGLVVPEVIHATFTSFIKYTEEIVNRHGYNLILGNTQSDPEVEEQFIDTLLRRNVDGVIFCRVSDKSRVLGILERTNVPIVVLDRSLGSENVHIPLVSLNNRMAGVLAAEHLSDLGHAQCACITGPMDIALSRKRLEGFKSHIESRGLSLDTTAVVEGDFRFGSGVQAMRTLFERRAKFSAIWAQSDLMAIGALQELQRRGIAVPEEVSLIGMDDINFAEMMVPTLTTIAQPFERMCEEAVQLILRQQENKPVPENRIVLDPELIIRESTARK